MVEGESGEEVYFLSRGIVAIVAAERQVAMPSNPMYHWEIIGRYLEIPAGHQVATLTNGDCFGEIALLVPGLRRTASIVAQTFCEAHQSCAA